MSFCDPLQETHMNYKDHFRITLKKEEKFGKYMPELPLQMTFYFTLLKGTTNCFKT